MRGSLFCGDTVDGYLNAKEPAGGTLALLSGAVAAAWLLVIVEFALVAGAWYAWADPLGGADSVWVFSVLVAALTSLSVAVVLWASAAMAWVRWARRRSVGHDSQALGSKGRLLLEHPRAVMGWTILAYAVPAVFAYGWLLTTFP